MKDKLTDDQKKLKSMLYGWCENGAIPNEISITQIENGNFIIFPFTGLPNGFEIPLRGIDSDLEALVKLNLLNCLGNSKYIIPCKSHYKILNN